MQGKNTRSAQVLLSQIPPKQQMLWRNWRGTTKEEINKLLQDLDPKASLHIEERLIAGKVDLDLLSLSPQKDARTIGGVERKQAFEGQQWRREDRKSVV